MKSYITVIDGAVVGSPYPLTGNMKAPNGTFLTFPQRLTDPELAALGIWPVEFANQPDAMQGEVANGVSYVVDTENTKVIATVDIITRDIEMIRTEKIIEIEEYYKGKNDNVLKRIPDGERWELFQLYTEADVIVNGNGQVGRKMQKKLDKLGIDINTYSNNVMAKVEAIEDEIADNEKGQADQIAAVEAYTTIQEIMEHQVRDFEG